MDMLPTHTAGDMDAQTLSNDRVSAGFAWPEHPLRLGSHGSRHRLW